jgi:hypothetical protein
MPLRWSGHLPLAIRIVLSGEDEHGRTFTESTQTLGVDRRGARILTSHHIGLGAEVAVENRAVGRTAKAKVVWRGDDASPQKPAELVVELIEPSESGSIWGIRFPSRNDKKPSAPTPLQVSPAAAPAENGREDSSVGRPEPGELIPATTGGPSGSAVEPEAGANSPVEWSDLSAELEALTSSVRLDSQSSLTTSTAETHPRTHDQDGHATTQRSLETSVAETAREALAALQDHAERLRRSVDEAVSSASLAAEKAVAELRAAREETETGLRARTEDYGTRVAELSASSIEELQRRSESLFESFQQKMQAALDHLQQKGAMELAQSFQETAEAAGHRSADQLQRQAVDAWKSLTEQLQASGAALVDEAGKRLADVTQSCVERITQSAETATNDGRLQAARALEEQTAAVGRSAESAAQSIQLASSEALANLESARRQTEAVLETDADGFRRRITELSASELEGLQRQADALLESFESRLLQNTLQEFQQKVAQQVADQIPGITRDLLERSANQLQQQAGDVVGRLSEELKASGAALVDETRERIAALTGVRLESLSGELQALDEASRHQLAQMASQCAQAAVDSIKLATEEAVTALGTAQGKVQTSTEAHAEQYEKRLAELSASGIEELERSAAALLDGSRSRLQSALNDFHQTGAAELSDRLRKVAEAVQERSLDQLQKQAADTLKASNHALQASRTALVDETRERTAAVVTASLESLSGKVQAVEEEARTKLDETACRCVQRACDSIALAADNGVARMQTAQAAVQATADTQTENCAKRLAELSASSFEESELMARGLREKFQAELQSTLDDFHRQGTTELSDRIHRFAGDLEQRCVEQMQRQADEAFKSLTGELRTSGAKLVDEAKQRLADTAQTSQESLVREVKAVSEERRGELAQTVSNCAREATDSLGRAGEQALARLQAAQEEAAARFTNDVERQRNLLADLSASGSEEVQRTADSVLDGFSHSLKEKARATSEQAGDQLRGTLQQLAAGSLRESESKHEALVKKQRKIFQDNIDFACKTSFAKLTQKFTTLEQEQRRSVVPGLALGLLTLAPTILFVYLSTRPVRRLRVDPPAEFLAAIEDVAPNLQATEERLARSYWDWAYLHLQHKYPFAAQLPEDPPMEMMEVEGPGFPTGLEAELTKRRYWRKLRQIWAMPQAWEKSSLWELK